MPQVNPIVWTTQGVYTVNHDRFLSAPEVPLFAVMDADVQYGHGADVVLRTLTSWAPRVRSAAPLGSSTAAEVLTDAVQQANAAVHADALTDQWLGCGSTVTCCTLTDTDVVVAHVGDSRLYIRRGGGWSRVTTDDTLVEQTRAHGTLDELENVLTHHASVIIRALGFSAQVTVATYATPWSKGDCLLLCTDGAWVLFDQEFAGKGPDGPQDPGELIEWLTRLHEADGSRTNATAMLVLL